MINDKETMLNALNVIFQIINILQDKYKHEDIEFTFLRLANLGIINIQLSYNSDLEKKDNNMEIQYKLFDIDKLNKIKENLLN